MLKKTGADDEWYSTAGDAIILRAFPAKSTSPAIDQEILEHELVVQMISFCAEWMEM